MKDRTPPPALGDETPLYGVCDAAGNILAHCSLDHAPALVLWRHRAAAELAAPGRQIMAMDETMWGFLAGIEGYTLDIRDTPVEEQEVLEL